jgi:hypothetical protein
VVAVLNRAPLANEALERVLAGMDMEERAEALTTIELLSQAVHDACEIWGPVHVGAVLYSLGRKLALSEGR